MSVGTTIETLEARIGKTFYSHQIEAIEHAAQQGDALRMCLYHAMGKGKTITALASMAAVGVSKVIVLAPPVTQKKWVADGDALGIEVIPTSHAKFRMSRFRQEFSFTRKTALIVDEFHLLGGHTGKGWKKLDAMARGMRAPLILCSATPSYNDVERVYCVAHVLDPQGHKGGFIEFLYRHCITKANPFGQIPNVVGLQNYPTAEMFLADLPSVFYVEDEQLKQITIEEVELDLPVPEEFDGIGLSVRDGRLMASLMEARHKRARLQLLNDDGTLNGLVTQEIHDLIVESDGVALLFCSTRTIAEAVHYAIAVYEFPSSVGIVHGQMSSKVKDTELAKFITGEYNVLVGTSTMATGFDGADEVCDTLVLVQDTDDESLRNQLIGRILPRGSRGGLERKRIVRLVY